MLPITYSVSKGLRAGAIGGFIGSIVLGILGAFGALAMNQELFYTTIARRMGFGDSSVLGGWTLHFTFTFTILPKRCKNALRIFRPERTGRKLLSVAPAPRNCCS